MAKKQNKFEKQEEQLQEVNNALTGAGRWIEKYQKQLSYGALALLVVVAGVFIFKQQKANANARAAEESNAANGEVFFAFLGAQQQAEQEGKSVWAYYAEHEELVEDIMSAADSYSNQQGKLAALFAGECLYKMGRFEEAIEYLEKFSSNDLNFKAAGKQLLGDAYSEAGNYEAAVEAYQAAANTGNQVFAPSSLKKAGIIYLSKLNDKESAYEAFNTIKEKYAISAEAGEIEKYLYLAK